ncbi:outer membrane protein assembly factor BamB family protein [Haladaptatus pallidirubidus]|nr:PQQ-binding-like beta-propeller repeat protein [Haladaptatus pallidirubidus]
MSVADGSVYVLNDTEGRIISLDADAGTEQWNTTLPVDEDDVSGYAISNGVIYLTANPDTVYALSADDGSALWTKTAEHSMADSTIDEISAPAVANGVVYVGTDDDYEWNKPENSEEMGAVHAFGGQTGEEVWRFETAADIQGPPTVADGQVYIGGEYASQDAWEDESEYSDHPSDLVGTVYSSNVVYALDADSGDESWSYAVSRYTNDKRVRGIAVANGDVYAWTDDDATYYPSGELFALTSSDERPNSDERLADDSLYEQNSRPTETIETEPPNADEKEFEGGETVSLDASNSTDSDGEIVSYEWDLDGDGEFETTGTTAEVTVPDCEILEVTLRVTDDDGSVGTGSAELRGK